MQTAIKFFIEEGQETFTTPLIKGKLDCVIVSSNKEVEIIIIGQKNTEAEIILRSD